VEKFWEDLEEVDGADAEAVEDDDEDLEYGRGPVLLKD
jgi:hypothetical protein